MVDFNSEGMLGTNRAHILDLVVLERRDEFLSKYQKFKESSLQNNSDKNLRFYKLKAALQVLYLELEELLIRQVREDKYKITASILDQKINSCESDEELIYCYKIINKVLDSINITRIDNKQKIDFTDIEASNVSKGL